MYVGRPNYSLLAVAGARRCGGPVDANERYLSGVSGCNIRGLASPVVRELRIRVGKGNGYNRACAANAVLLYFKSL